MLQVDLHDPSLLDELVEIVSEMLDGIAEASVPDGHILPVTGYDGQTVESKVDILGSETYTLTVRVQASVAVGLAAAMMDEDPADLLAEDASAMLSELTNVLGGSVKSLVEEETALGIPESVVHETDQLPALDGSVFVDHDLCVLQVRLGE